MVETTMQSLFNTNRFPGGFSNINLFLYFPIGLFLAIVRMFISLHVLLICQLLPHGSNVRRFVLKVMSGVLGFLVTVDGGDKLESCKAKVVVSNHVSVVDHFLTDLVFPCTAPVERLPSFFLQLISKLKKLPSTVNKEEMLNEVKRICHQSKCAVLFYPEQTTTNGQGLLKFSTVAFELEEEIQPIAVRCSRPPLFKMSMTTLEGSWIGDVFWCFFVPCTFYRISILPVIKKKEEETVAELTERVRCVIAQYLNIDTTNYTYSDKIEYIKQLHRSSGGSSPNSTSNSQTVNKPPTSINPPTVSSDLVINNMVKQVKAVMPHVPVAAILKDIEKTKDVDLTITHILDGIVQFTPQQIDSSSCEDKESLLACPSTQKFSSTSFGRSSKDREMSFEDRKKAMIEAARQKYKQKHNLP